MKKIDTFFLSDKQIEQMKNQKKSNKKLAKFAVIMLASTAGILLASHTPEILQSLGMSDIGFETIESLLTGIGGLGAIVGVVNLTKRTPSNHRVDSATQQRINELRADEYYPDEFWNSHDKSDEHSRKSKRG